MPNSNTRDLSFTNSGHPSATSVSCAHVPEVSQALRIVQRALRYGSHRSKMAARRSAHLPVLQAVRAIRNQPAE